MSHLKRVLVDSSMLHRLHHRMQAVSNVVITGKAEAMKQWPVAREALQRQGATDVPEKLPEEYSTVVPKIAHPLFTAAGNELLEHPRLQLMKEVRREGLHVVGLYTFRDDWIIDGDAVQRLIDGGFASFDRGDYQVPLMEEMGELHRVSEHAEAVGYDAVRGAASNVLHAYAPPIVAQGFFELVHDAKESVRRELPSYLRAGVERRILKEIITGTANYKVADYGRLREWNVISQGMHEFFVDRLAPGPEFHH